MSVTTNLFSDKPEIINFGQSPTRVSEDCYRDALWLLNFISDLTKGLNTAYPKDFVQTLDTPIEDLMMYYMDYIEELENNSKFDLICQYVENNVYSTDATVLEITLRFIPEFKELLKTSREQLYNVDEQFFYMKPLRDYLNYRLPDINYIFLKIFKVIGKDPALPVLKNYCDENEVDAVQLCIKSKEYYKENRPHLKLLDTNPELLDKLEEVLGEDVCADLLEYAYDLKKSEIYDIIAGRLVVDDEFINMLDERRQKSEEC